MVNTTAFFPLWARDDKNINITVLDDEGAVVDISTATLIKWAMAVSEISGVIIAKSFPASGITIIDGPNGIFQVDLDPLDSTQDPGTYYQTSFIKLSGDVNHVAVGTVWLRGTPPGI